jgi:hypothetical protein
LLVVSWIESTVFTFFGMLQVVDQLSRELNLFLQLVSLVTVQDLDEPLI